MLRSSLYLSLLVMLTACSSHPPQLAELTTEALHQEQAYQWQQALQYQTAQRNRLQQVAFPVLRSATRLCPGRQRYGLGLILHQRYAYPEEQQAAAEALFGKLQQPTVRYVISGSPADSQIEVGDQLLAINGRNIRPTLDDTLLRLQAALKAGDSIKLRLQRQDRIFEVGLQPALICDYPVEFSNSERVNGYADGRTIRITAGMLRFAAADEELALIIAHELAHNLLRHNAQEVIRLSLGGLLDLLLTSSGIPSPGIAMGLAGTAGLEQFEAESDILGLHLVADSGMVINGLPEFWRRLATRYPDSINSKGITTHPGTAERYLRMQQEVERLLHNTGAPPED